MILEARLLPTVAKTRDLPEFTVLTFTDEMGAIVDLHLPPRMSACASMIVEAFNAHMVDSPGNRAAQAGVKVELGLISGDIVPFPTGGPLRTADEIAALAVEGEHHE